ncbi:MAG: hypothetical protein K2G88_03990, partial [Oscillospiraceae bacterium]|nr:hypothetical protein [Oscillospiraceae bacterium]
NNNKMGIIIINFSILGGLIYIIIPHVREKIFQKKLLRMTPQQASSALFQHMRQQLRLSDNTTVDELAEHSRFFCPESVLYQALNVLLYCHNPAELSAMTARQLAEAYIQWQASKKRFEKEQAKTRKQNKK